MTKSITKNSNDIDYVTKDYLRQELAAAEERIVKQVNEQVGTLLSDALDMIAARFDRIERKLDALVVQVDDHSIRLNHLEQKVGIA